jgi:hypothetical protein
VKISLLLEVPLLISLLGRKRVKDGVHSRYATRGLGENACEENMQCRGEENYLLPAKSLSLRGSCGRSSTALMTLRDLCDGETFLTYDLLESAKPGLCILVGMKS